MGDILGGMTDFAMAAYGAQQAGKEREKAEAMLKAAYAEYEALGYPPDLSEKLAFEEMRQAGVLTPELEAEMKLGPSDMSKVQQNQEMLESRKKALGQLQERSRTGMTPEERAQMNALTREADSSAEAKRQQIIQEAQARGIAGGGQELAGQYIASQSGANRAMQAAEQTGAIASRRALEALLSGSELAGQMGREQLALDTTKANASDLINKFNTQNAVERQARNVNRSNQAQALNLSEKQRLQDANVNTRNQEILRANEARRQNYMDNFTLASAKSNARMAQVEQQNNKAQQTANNWKNIAAGAGGLVKSGVDYYNQPAKTSNTSSQFVQPDSTATVTNNNIVPYAPGYMDTLRKYDPRD